MGDVPGANQAALSVSPSEVPSDSRVSEERLAGFTRTVCKQGELFIQKVWQWAECLMKAPQPNSNVKKNKIKKWIDCLVSIRFAEEVERIACRCFFHSRNLTLKPGTFSGTRHGSSAGTRVLN